MTPAALLILAASAAAVAVHEVGHLIATTALAVMARRRRTRGAAS